jgi:putative DNA primase/helicase
VGPEPYVAQYAGRHGGSGDRKAPFFHDRGDYLSRRTATTPTDAIVCPRWLEALEQIFAADGELIEYVQRPAGYTLTGLVSEQILFFLFGWGGNGKNIVAETLAGVLCDYAIVAPMSLLLEQRHEQHPTELAVLRGARMALGSEVDPGRGWAEAKLKALTGRDRITARLMRGDFFEFTPQFKFWLRANHKPRLRTVDAAMRRRLHLVPFRVQFTGRQQDPSLCEKLRQSGLASFAGRSKDAGLGKRLD